jgi:predicted permease
MPATWALACGLALHGTDLPVGASRLLQLLTATVAPTTMFALGLGLHFVNVAVATRARNGGAVTSYSRHRYPGGPATF